MDNLEGSKAGIDNGQGGNKSFFGKLTLGSQGGEGGEKIKINDRELDLSNAGQKKLFVQSLNTGAKKGLIKIGDTQISKTLPGGEPNPQFQTTVDALKMLENGQAKTFAEAQKLAMRQGETFQSGNDEGERGSKATRGGRSGQNGSQGGNQDRQNVDGSPDRRFQDNGQGDVKDPQNDGRLKSSPKFNEETHRGRGQGEVKNPDADQRLRQNDGGQQGQGQVKNPETDHRLGSNTEAKDKAGMTGGRR